MANNGYIKMHRKILDNCISRKPEYAWLWTVILLKANHKSRHEIFNDRKIEVRAGQFITGRKSLSAETGISESKIYRILKYLENEHQIEQQKTNKYTIVTVLNWHRYQGSEQQNEQLVNNKRTTNEQPVNTNKNDKNVKNGKKKRTPPTPYQKIQDTYNQNRGTLPELKMLSGNRKDAIRLRYKKYGLDKLTTLFAKAGKSDFLNGKNNINWKASFDWLIEEANMVKVLEGNYDNKDKPVGKKYERVT